MYDTIVLQVNRDDTLQYILQTPPVYFITQYMHRNKHTVHGFLCTVVITYQLILRLLFGIIYLALGNHVVALVPVN